MKKILIVEDDRVVASIYRNKLVADGYEVAVAGDGDLALTQVRTNQPDLIVLDLGLPKINGVEVLKKVRSEPKTAAMPVIVLSNSYVTDMVHAAWKAGATRCLTKSSCTPRELIEVLESLVPKPVPEAPAPAKPAPLASVPTARRDTYATPTDSLAPLQARQSFLAGGPGLVSELRKKFQSVAQLGASNSVTADLAKFYGLIHSLTGHAAVTGLTRIATLSAALEALARELQEKPESIGPSPIRSIAQGIDTLGELFHSTGETAGEDGLPPMIMVVDDDVISRKALSMALERARLRAVTFDEALPALKCLEGNAFDLIFTDVNMPGLSGFEFCQKLREFPIHKTTPVVFVTMQNDFQSKAASKLSGGTDLIGKPFLLSELAVKSLTLLHRKPK